LNIIIFRTPAESAALIEAGVEVYKEVIANLKEGVKGLFIAEEMTNVAKGLASLNIEMEDKQKEALDSILKINVEAQLAINSARVVVSNLRNICDVLIYILNNVQNEEGLKIAIETYLEESKLLDPDVDKAIEKLSTVSAESVKGNTSYGLNIHESLSFIFFSKFFDWIFVNIFINFQLRLLLSS